MKLLLTILLLTMLATGCQPRILSGPELENKLKETLTDYLQKTTKPGTTITVKDVAFYPDQEKKLYNCEFHVNIKTPKSDTTGVVQANISNDFTAVERLR